MFRLVVVLGLVAFCAARTPIDHCCSAEDRNIIQEQWQGLTKDVDSSKIKIAFGRKLILKLVELQPDSKPLFAGVDIDNPTGGVFSAYSLRLFDGVDMIINLLKDPEAFEAALEYTAAKYGKVAGAKKVYFQTIGEILSAALPKVLDEYNSLSWRSCFRYILTTAASQVSA